MHLFGCRTNLAKSTPCTILVCTESLRQPKSPPACIPIYMTFTNWLQQKHAPASDRIAMIIQSAGQNGIPETQLRSGIELPKKLVDELLQALVDARIVRVAERDGIRWYFTPL